MSKRKLEPSNNSDLVLSDSIREDIVLLSKIGPDLYVPSISIDTVIFGFVKGQLTVLLPRFWNTEYYCLPGGFLEKEEEMDDAAERILESRTGLNNILLEQFYTSGKRSRSAPDIIIDLWRKLNIDLPVDNWFDQRFISVCYYAVVDQLTTTPKPSPFMYESTWFPVNDLPLLLFDHKDIIAKALSRLQSDLDHKIRDLDLMQETFTMASLQKVYEAILQKKLDRTNFQRKLLSMKILERLEKKHTGKAHRSPYLYRFFTENELRQKVQQNIIP